MDDNLITPKDLLTLKTNIEKVKQSLKDVKIVINETKSEGYINNID